MALTRAAPDVESALDLSAFVVFADTGVIRFWS
jgi:hypothetical protein